VPAVPVGDSARRAVAAATAAAIDPEEDCLRGIPVPVPVPESNPEAEPAGEKLEGVGENAVGEKLEAGDGAGAVGDGVPEWYARAFTSMDRPSGEDLWRRASAAAAAAAAVVAVDGAGGGFDADASSVRLCLRSSSRLKRSTPTNAPALRAGPPTGESSSWPPSNAP